MSAVRSSAVPLPRAALLDIDGTLVDSNDEHARSWQSALDEHGHRVSFSRIRSLIGMGGDKLLPIVAGLDGESDAGRAIAHRKAAIFRQSIPSLRPTRGARKLLSWLHAQNVLLVVATSAERDEVDALLQIANVADLMHGVSSSSDVEDSKPDPDVVESALKRAGTDAAEAILIGDTPYDVEAAARAGVSTIALRCGGWWSDEDLAGAIAVYDDPEAVATSWASARP